MTCSLSRIQRAVLVGAPGSSLIFLPDPLEGEQQESDSGRAVIEVAGDVLPESSWKASEDAAHIFDGVRDEFAKADLVFVNLEEPITSANTVTRNKNFA